MAMRNLILRRLMTTQSNSISRIFVQDNIQKLLVDITRYEEEKLFARKPVDRLKTPKLMFMTDNQLEVAKKEAYEKIKARVQMPPVMDPDLSEPKTLARDEEIVGYTKHKVMFIDISPGFSNRNRLMSIRETDGTLRYPTHEERNRLNHIFYPDKFKSIDPPKMFEEKHLLSLLQRKKYIYVLDRACVQFEPDDPRYHDVTSSVYKYIDSKSDYARLRSTRHFGPMSLYLAFNKMADGLILEMLSLDLVEDAVKLVKIYNTCHNIETMEADNLDILKHYSEQHSSKRYNLDLALQELETKTKTKTKD